MKNLNKYLVFNFATGERTKNLSNHCFEKLGFDNIVTIDNKDSFYEKYLTFAKLGVESNFDFFIRSDADRLVFNGLLEMIEFCEKNNQYSNVTGAFFDLFMNKFRGGTPSFFKRDTLEELVNNPKCISDNQKPETQFGRYLESMPDRFKCKNVNILTNLHEYEQYPSKICNVFINRLSRNHWGLYDVTYLETLDQIYKNSINEAINYHNKNGNKKSMSFVDFNYLDKNLEPIQDTEISKLYEVYKSLYGKIKRKYQ